MSGSDFFVGEDDMLHRTHSAALGDAPWWLGIIPAVVYPGLMVALFLWPSFYIQMVTKEGGIEWLGFGVLVVGAVVGIWMLATGLGELPNRWLRVWYVLVVLGVILFAGEEVSWGQHMGFWTTEDLPQPLQKWNDQGESNLHNFSNALDQGPTNLVVLGTLVGYVIIPLVLRHRRETMGVDNPGYWFWPTRVGLIAAVGVLLIPWPKRLYEWTTGLDGPQALRHSEIHEFYVAVMMTTYLISAHYRLRALKAASAAGDPAATGPEAPAAVAAVPESGSTGA